MAAKIPLFPLKLVVYPDEPLNLHIFEPRYKQLIRECHEENIQFGIPTFRESEKLEYGTLMKLTDIHKTHQDGNMDITAIGISVFRLIKFYKEMAGKLYPGGEVFHLPLDVDGDKLIYIQIVEKIKEMFEYMKIQKQVPSLNTSLTTYKLAHQVGFSEDQEYEFLRIGTEIERQRYMLSHLTRLLPLIKQIEEFRRKAQQNGHFKNLTSPEL